jgi:hypothetical protein
MKKINKRKVANKNRRKFLKVVAFGGIALFAMKLFGGKIFALAASYPPKRKRVENESKKIRTSESDIDMVENHNGVVFVDKRTGEEIFILEKD